MLLIMNLITQKNTPGKRLWIKNTMTQFIYPGANQQSLILRRSPVTSKAGPGYK